MTSSLSIATTRDPKSWLHLPRERQEALRRSSAFSSKLSEKLQQNKTLLTWVLFLTIRYCLVSVFPNVQEEL